MTDDKRKDEHIELLIRIDQKVNGINERLDIQNGRIGKTETRLEDHETRLAVLAAEAIAKQRAKQDYDSAEFQRHQKSDRTIKVWLAVLSLAVGVASVVVAVLALRMN